MTEPDWGEIRFEEIKPEEFYRMKKELPYVTDIRGKSVIHDFTDFRVMEIYNNKAGLTKYLRQERPR